jgi:molybdopterin synthase catalytic subunit
VADVAAAASITVSVQEADFEVGQLQSSLLAGLSEEGAVATFTGYVRGANEAREVHSMQLEHYPGMTESSIRAIVEEAATRWQVLAATVVHRVGTLTPGDRVVWVGVASSHRAAAFAACEFIMDFLKTRAPFWKKESGPGGEHWVSAQAQDDDRAARWEE